MCGIVGYSGNRNALPLLLEGLKTLEYRGYDSSGIVIAGTNGIRQKKSVGKIEALEKALGNLTAKQGVDFEGKLGIAHTRWATHGIPNETNAHPHSDCTNRVFLVHNGIIENYKELKEFLLRRGHKFSSETDTEIVAHLIEDILREETDFKNALCSALKIIRGAYALAIIDTKNPNTLYATRISSPLVIGVNHSETFVASDPSAVLSNTKEVIYLKDGELAEICLEKVTITDLEKQPVPFEIVELEWDIEQAKKGDFAHFMEKEIFEGPEVVRTAMRGRLDSRDNSVKLGGLSDVTHKLDEIKRLIILGCGTSYYAGLVGEYLFEEISKIPTEVHIASEFRYRNEPLEKDTAVLAISQSGETADTLAGLEKAKDAGLLTLGVVNAVGSTISRETIAGVYNHAGPEIGVASTKAFISQLTIMTLLSIFLAKRKKKSVRHDLLLKELVRIPEKMERILAQAEKIKKLAEIYGEYDNFLFLGRRYNSPVALEGALKLKEISYVHAEGYGAGEMKHGPIAMISPDFPTLALVPKNSICEKMYSNIEEIKARGGPILAIATEGDESISSLADDVFYIPATIEPLEPLLTVIPLQLFAYYVGIKRGHDVDKPRNLAKSVTVE